jgi:hypothetical protein
MRVLLNLGLIFAMCSFASCQDDSRTQPTSTSTLTIGGGAIGITLPGESMKLSQADLLAWVKRAATAVSQFYGRFPARELTLRVRAGNGSGVRHGVTYPWGGGLILVSVGREATTDDLNDDWVLTHEMIHLAFPNMDEDQHWIEEGISTYVEPVARVAAGQMQAEEMWRVFVRDMPKGQPQAGDHGLDNTHTWGRTYWGGALFCLFADVEIREQTHNRYGLRDALRAIMDHGGVITQDWRIDEAFKVGDKGTGTRVLEDLYAQMRDKPSPMDLDELWKRLGISLQNGHAQFNDKAPDAAIRKAITSPAH